MKEIKPLLITLSMLLGWCANTFADGSVINKITHPYVEAMEQELELLATYQDKQPDTDNNLQGYSLSYGSAINDQWFAEITINANKSDHQQFEVEAIELEANWQLTEQGELWADWGLLFELEKEIDEDSWEFTAGLIAEKEWDKISGTANLLIIQEWGADTADELETALALQTRYRHTSTFESAIEFYSDQNTQALGPAILGQFQLGANREIQWEAGLIFGLTDKSPNKTLRLAIEYEL